MTILYTYKCGYTGLTYRYKVFNVASVLDEVYPPGGELRVCRNDKGQIIASPLVSEIQSWEILR
jgi:hypothetical protein